MEEKCSVCWLNSRVFRGVKKIGVKRRIFTHETDFALISTIFIRLGQQCTPNFFHQFDQHPQMFRNNTFFAPKWIKKIPTKKKDSVRRDKSIISKHLWMLVKLVEKFGVHCWTSCKITAQTDKYCVNESKIRFVSKNSSFYAHFLPPIFLTKKHMSLTNILDTPRQFFCAGSNVQLMIWSMKQTPAHSHK
jgi:hypothetical protein